MFQDAVSRETGITGQIATQLPVMARLRKVDAQNCLIAARNALASAEAAQTETGRAIWAARLSTGLIDIAAIELHADATIRCLEEVKRLASAARARVEGVPA